MRSQPYLPSLPSTISIRFADGLSKSKRSMAPLTRPLGGWLTLKQSPENGHQFAGSVSQLLLAFN